MNETSNIEQAEFEDTTKVYEVGFLFIPTLSEENVGTAYRSLREAVEEKGGNIISEEPPRFRDLSYPMLKHVIGKNQIFKSAFFGWIKFEINTDKLHEIKTGLDENPNIIRYILINTTREDTYTPKPLSAQVLEEEEEVVGNTNDEELDESELEEEDIEEEKAKVEEEIDKSIDELVNE